MPNTRLRVGFYMDMFLPMIDTHGVLRGPPASSRGAFIAREDAALAVAQAAVDRPGGAPEVSGPELLTFADIAAELTIVSGKVVQFVEESRDVFRERLDGSELPQRIRELELGWRDSLAAGEQAPVTDNFARLLGRAPLTLRQYLSRFPQLISGSPVEPGRRL
ncbi:MAG: hypothetical protein ACREX6_01110 [Casimicrobiaceae bacterium]